MHMTYLSFERNPVLDSSRKRGMSCAWQFIFHMKRNAKSKNGLYRQKKPAVVYTTASFFVKRISEGIVSGFDGFYDNSKTFKQSESPTAIAFSLVCFIFEFVPSPNPEIHEFTISHIVSNDAPASFQYCS